MSDAIYSSSRHDRPHARIYDHHLQHEAWRRLSCIARVVIMHLLAAYRPNKPNCFPAGGRTVGGMVGVSERTAKKAIDELLEAGHLREERTGRNRGQVKTRERMVSLTRWDTETLAGDPDLPIKLWRSLNNPENLQAERGKKSGSGESEVDPNANQDGAIVIPLKTANTRI